VQGGDVVAQCAHDLGPVEDAPDLLRRAAVLHVGVVEDVVERASAAVLADDVFGDELLGLRSLKEKRERTSENVANARHGGSLLFRILDAVKAAKPAWRFAERVVEGRDDAGAAERVVIWIDRRPGALWTVGRTVNPQLGTVRYDDGDGLWQGYELDDALEAANAALEDDCVVSEDDGFDGRVRPFRREELLRPLERLFFGHPAT
jgi:hypothetical protein